MEGRISMVTRDGHIHTHFCPHGTKDSFTQYVERAISLGFKEITFTEHAPLPDNFEDTTPTKDSSIKIEELPNYLKEVQQIKDFYRDQLKINIGLEVDYIEGYESEIKNFLLEWGHFLDDSILSVHFLKNNNTNKYDCVDYSPELFSIMIEEYGSVDKIYNCYYNTILKSIRADLGPYKPVRIGHITLVNKFQLLYKAKDVYYKNLLTILQEVKKRGYTLDYNGAGVNKLYCKEPYPPNWVVEEAKKLNIPLVYGSDAHQAMDLGQGLDRLLINNR